MRTYTDIGIQTGEVLLPKAGTDLEKWAVIACDQFTSQPGYWEQVREIVGNAPSTLHLILPEVFLGSSEEQTRIQSIRETMRCYLDDGLLEPHEGMIYVERSVGGRTRHGLMLALDLEQYNFSPDSQSIIRATEGTILNRLPPRIRIRAGASLELPHILVLIDDPDRTVIEPLAESNATLKMLYNTDLMLGSGHLRGYQVSSSEEERIVSALRQLAQPEHFRQKYQVGEDKGVLLFAMGDGNHSLATAKSIWEQMKASVGPDHPARYALVEIENVHDQGLVFEPIHRVLFGVRQNVLAALQNHFGQRVRIENMNSADEMISAVQQQPNNGHSFGIVTSQGASVITVMSPSTNLPVGTLQEFIDEWSKQNGFDQVDYVHGDEVVIELGAEAGNMGIYLPGMQKSDLFKTVILDGVLPRKTFSMGEAKEKRFYMESRKITA